MNFTQTVKLKFNSNGYTHKNKTTHAKKRVSTAQTTMAREKEGERERERERKRERERNKRDRGGKRRSGEYDIVMPSLSYLSPAQSEDHSTCTMLTAIFMKLLPSSHFTASMQKGERIKIHVLAYLKI